ncbi:MAG: hypothetical protein AB1772_01030 [Candidatus Zixiibacteriota bacterium]
MRQLICIALLALAACSANQEPPQPLRFTYHPPDSVSFVVELAMTQVSAQDQQQMVDSTWTRTRHSQVAVPGGYQLSGLTDTVIVFRDGQPVINPLVGLFSQGHIVFQIDASGRITRVSGFQELLDKLDQLVGADTAAAVRQAVTAQVLEQQEIETWNAKFSPFVEREMRLGQAYCDTTYPTLPVEGRLTSYGISELVDTVRIGSKLCGKLLITSSTNPAELARLSDRTVDDVNKLFGLGGDAASQAAQRQAGLSTRREWLVEFESMLSHTESSRQEAFYYELTASGMPVKNTISESQSKKFVYP